MRPQYVKHDPESLRCGCWSCANQRLVADQKIRRAKQRLEARALTQELVVASVRREDGQHYTFSMGRRWVGGLLREILGGNHGENECVVAAFLSLEMQQRQDVLDAAARREEVRVADLWPKWDEEYIAEEPET